MSKKKAEKIAVDLLNTICADDINALGLIAAADAEFRENGNVGKLSDALQDLKNFVSELISDLNGK